MLRLLRLSAAFVTTLLALLGPLFAEEPPAIPRSLLESGEWEKRVEGLKRLGARKGDDAAAEAAIRLLEDVDWEVQIEATRALGAIGTEDARDALLDVAVKGEIAWIRDAAVEALTAFDHAETAPRLLKRVRTYREESQKVSALEAFGHLAPTDLVSDLRTWTRHKDVRVAAAAVRAVALIAARDPKASEAVLKLVDHPLDRRAKHKHFFAYIAAIDALGALDASRARLRLFEEFLSLETEDPYVPTRIARHVARMDPMRIRSAAGDSLPLADEPKLQRRLVRLIGEAHVVPLAPMVEKKDWKIRATAYEAMGRLRAPKAIPRLTFGLEDKDPLVRGVCHANLQILTREKFGEDPKKWRKWWTKHGEAPRLKKRSRMTKEEKEAEEAERERTRYAHERYEFERERGVEILQKARILVVSGAWDHVEIVPKHLDIPHTALRAQHLKSIGLNPNQIVLVNCEGNLDRGSQDRLRWFVNVGGYVMTTDWALTKTVNLCFPGYLAQYPGSTTGNDVVVVQEARPGHPFTRGVFTNVPTLMWWLEIQALPFIIRYPEPCDVLVDSAEMMQRYGSSPMASVFRWGLGKVQHSVSHFSLQEEGMQKASKPRDRMVFAADNLGLSLAQIRKLRTTGAFEGKLNEETMREIAPDYSMFRTIVNVVKEKSDWVENL